MPERTSISVSLPPDLRRFVRARVTSGHYYSASDVIEEGLRLLERKEEAKDAALRELRDEIAVGLAQARRGELLDGEKVFRELQERGRKRRGR